MKMCFKCGAPFTPGVKAGKYLHSCKWFPADKRQARCQGQNGSKPCYFAAATCLEHLENMLNENEELNINHMPRPNINTTWRQKCIMKWYVTQFFNGEYLTLHRVGKGGCNSPPFPQKCDTCRYKSSTDHGPVCKPKFAHYGPIKHIAGFYLSWLNFGLLVKCQKKLGLSCAKLRLASAKLPTSLSSDLLKLASI